MAFQVIQGDCLAEMAKLPPNSVDACITDPPYGTTACSWDSVIPFAPMWTELKRIVKPKGAIVLFGSQPFTSALVMSNPAMFKWEDIWQKSHAVGHLNAYVQPLRQHENILIFRDSRVTFNPQFSQKPLENVRPFSGRTGSNCYGDFDGLAERTVAIDVTFPRSVFKINNHNNAERGFHPTQKPVDLLRYLVRTYTNAGDTVLDFTCGSGTTGVACEIEGRDSINIDSDAHYCEVARARMLRASGIACDIPRPQRAFKPTPLFDTQAQPEMSLETLNEGAKELLSA